MGEVWRPVVGYDGVYEVSSLGRLRRCGWARGVRAWKITKTGAVNPAGYLVVSLSKNDRLKTFLLHRLVAFAFLGEKPEGHEIHHIDRNRSNNAISNLEWRTHSRNLRLAYENGTKLPVFNGVPGEEHWAARLTEAKVREIRSRAESGENHRRVARDFGIHPSVVSRIKNRRAWKCVA